MSQTVSKRNTTIAVVIVAIIAVASTYGLVTSVVPRPVVTVVQTAVAGPPVKLCGSIELTGRLAEDGVWVRDTYTLWGDYVNSQGGLLGRPVQIILYDDGSDADRAVANYERCATVDKTDLLLGNFGSPLVYPTIVVSEKYKMVYISPAGGAPRIFEDRKPKYYFFAQPATSDLQVRSFFPFLASLPAEQKPKTVALALELGIFGEGNHATAEREAKALNLQIVFDRYFVSGQPDYTVDALAVKVTNPDVIILGGNTLDAANWMKAVAQLGLKAKGIWIANGPQNPEWVATVGNLAEGTFGPISWSPFAKTFQNELYPTLWKQKYGTDAPSGGAEAWAAVQILEAAIKATKSFDNEVLAKYIHENTFNTIYGPGLKFDELGRPQGDYTLGQVQKGKIEIVYPKEVATASAVWPAGGAGSSLPMALATIPTATVPKLGKR